MKTFLVVGIILLFIGVAVAPSINQSVVTASQEDDLVEITTQACGIKGYGDTTVKLTKEQTNEIDQLFESLNNKLYNATSRTESVRIYHDVIIELDRYGLLPQGMSVEQAQQLVTNGNHDINIMEDDNELEFKALGGSDENFNCLIAGKTSYSEFFKPGQEIIPFTRLIFIKPLVNAIISFGREQWSLGGGSGDYYSNPASGWVWTNGSNGVKTWDGNSLWGNLGSYYYTWGVTLPVGPWNEGWFYEGATGFTGIRIKGLDNARFFGYASHVAITTEVPGKSQSKENSEKPFTPFVFNKFLFGKVSNVRSGGYTPAYWFHVDKVMIFACNQVPKVQWIEDCEAHMLSMNFRGFIFRGKTIIGLVSEFFIYE